MSNCEYRPCEVDGKQAIFHAWVQTSTPVPANHAYKGEPAGQLTQIFAIVEYEDGSVELEYPNNIIFTDLLSIRVNTTERKIDKYNN